MIKEAAFCVWMESGIFFFVLFVHVWGCMNINPSRGVLVGKNNDARLGQI